MSVCSGLWTRCLCQEFCIFITSQEQQYSRIYSLQYALLELISGLESYLSSCFLLFVGTLRWYFVILWMQVEVWWHLQVMGALKHCTCKINPLDCQRSSREDRRCLMLASFTQACALYVHMHPLYPLWAIHTLLCPQIFACSNPCLMPAHTLPTHLYPSLSLHAHAAPFSPTFTCSQPLWPFLPLCSDVVTTLNITLACSPKDICVGGGGGLEQIDGGTCFHLFSPTFTLVPTQGWQDIKSLFSYWQDRGWGWLYMTVDTKGTSRREVLSCYHFFWPSCKNNICCVQSCKQIC